MISIYSPHSQKYPIQWTWISLIGPDAQDFLHRLTTLDVKNLDLGQGHPACFLTAQGKIRAFFTLWHYGPQEYAFEFDAGRSGKWKSDLLALIDQYTFAEKIQVVDSSSELKSYWIFLEPQDVSLVTSSPLAPGHTLATEESIRLCYHGNLDYGRPWITAWGKPSQLSRWVEQKLNIQKEIKWEELESWRVQALTPQVDAEITNDIIPLEIGLKNTISENKGCYPGQEVIEKIISLGSPPKRLVRIDGQGMAPKVGSKILNFADSPQEIGQITSVSCQQNRYNILGWVKKIHAKEGLSVQFSDSLDSQAVISKIAPYA
jgi:folate-binding protein YgfZ